MAVKITASMFIDINFENKQKATIYFSSLLKYHLIKPKVIEKP